MTLFVEFWFYLVLRGLTGSGSGRLGFLLFALQSVLLHFGSSTFIVGTSPTRGLKARNMTAQAVAPS